MFRRRRTTINDGAGQSCGCHEAYHELGVHDPAWQGDREVTVPRPRQGDEMTMPLPHLTDLVLRV